MPALAHVPPADVAEAFEVLVEFIPQPDGLTDLVTYFEHTYIKGRRLRGRTEQYGPAVFPVETWNKYNAAEEGIARSTNSVEGWHHGLQALF